MVITLQDLSLFLQNLLSPHAFVDYCPNGIQVEGKKEIKKICFAVSASLAAIDQAIEENADVLIVHHGIFWNKDPYPIIGVKKDKLQRLLKQGISLLAYHLPLDAHPLVGNNWVAAKELGLSELEPFASIGVKGKIQPISVEELRSRLEAYYRHPAYTALGGKKQISSLAILSGGGHRSISEAVDAGVDCFITGSFDEPIWDIAHEQGVHFFALGHYATETIGIRALLQKVQEHFKIPCTFISLPNPF